jgi:hypothetical protein
MFSVFSALYLRIMGKKCVVAGCSNTHKEGVNLFKFPSDKRLKRLWIKQVQTTRAHWKAPTSNSVICSIHFSEDCFQPMSILSDKLGIKRKKLLLPDAVPTIRHTKKSLNEVQNVKRVSGAHEKRERARVC